MISLTIQAFVNGRWHDAAAIAFDDPDRGNAGGTGLTYDSDYFFNFGAIDALDRPVIDRRAVSVAQPLSLEWFRLPGWPAWLLDLMPQGIARQTIAQELGMRADDPAVEFHLLLRAGGAPVGNLRIKEAWESERRRIDDVVCPPLTDRDIEIRSEQLIEVVSRFALLASGSSGVQGEWPKALMTRSAKDGFWYPDPFVGTEDGAEHVILKMQRSQEAEDRLIIESEAPYLDLAASFGLNVAAPLRYANAILAIPRFDREVVDGRVLLHGQESLVAGIGVAQFGHVGHHERYLSLIQSVSADQRADTLEYVLRDVLNHAMGNPDNHGRNSALTKRADGIIRLSPLFDFAPMMISRAGIGRSTRWRCHESLGAEGRWRAICQAAAFAGLDPWEIADAILERLDFLTDLPREALRYGVPEEVVDRAIGRAPALAEEIAEDLKGGF